MKRLFSAASILALAGVAQGAAFNSLGFQAGGGLANISGTGFTVTGGSFFDQNGGAPNTSPATPAGMNAGNFLEFDSYFCLDPMGAAARNRSSVTGNNSNRTLSFYGDYGPPGGAAADYNIGEFASGYTITFGPGSHIGDQSGGTDPATPENRARVGLGVSAGDGTGVPPVGSGFAPNASGGRSMLDGVFIGRLTVSNGAALTGAIDFSVEHLNNAIDTHELILDGPGVAFITNNGPQVLALRSYLIAGGSTRATPLDITVAGLADFAGVDAGEPFGSADVYDLWVQVIPTPGALALLGLGGIAALRRRRA